MALTQLQPRDFIAFFYARFFFGPEACFPGLGMSAVGFTRSARRIASSVNSGMWTASPDFGIGPVSFATQ
jgi:hypothetical protein